MDESSQYLSKRSVWESDKTMIYRAVRQSDNASVMIKTFNHVYPSKLDVAKLNHEYAIVKSLNIDSVIQVYSLEEIDNLPTIIFENVEGETLYDFMLRGICSIDKFLLIAIELSSIIGDLHENGIVHKDIKPQNILINNDNNVLKILDFSFATKLPLVEQKIINTIKLEGTLAYMSPEQTGRMNRGVDYRSDYYSLGVTLYELLTGKLPFTTRDPVELVHQHIAHEPKDPRQIRDDIPEVISGILMKLLAKAPEERYQSIYGLKKDLETCLEEWQETMGIKPFVLGKKDLPSRFLIPQKLYGREKELDRLVESFDHVSKGLTELVLVAGSAGVGKTSLVQESWKYITGKSGYFVSGTFNKIRTDITNSPIVHALRDIIRQILSESEKDIDKWKERFLQALGKNGQIIIDIIPELEIIIGKQPPVPELPLNETQNRLNLVLQNFTSVFASVKKPIVIFLDDLQWSDLSTLKFLEFLITDSKAGYLLVIGAYRDNEVDAMHPLNSLLKAISNANMLISVINLDPLQLESINQLIDDTLKRKDEIVSSLAELCIQKTQGNPFFLIQFLRNLYENKLIIYDHHSGTWQIELDQIRQSEFTDNVVKLMANKIMRLSGKAQELLKHAACSGIYFDLTVLSIVLEKSKIEIIDDLWEALEEGLIIPLNDAYKYVQYVDSRVVPFRFLHERVQKAAYSMIDDHKKNEVHLKIGQLLLKNLNEEEREERLFDIVNQLNSGISLIENQDERNKLANLNQMAGRKAKASSAYQLAFTYLKTGIELLGEDKWDKEYELSLSLHVEATECAYLSTDSIEMNELVNVVLERGRNILDKVKAYEIRIQSFVLNNELLKAIKLGLAVLELLGVKIPEKPGKKDLLLDLAKTRLSWSRKKIEKLIDLPEMTDPGKLAIMRIQSSILFSAFVASPELFVFTVSKQTRLSLKHGNSFWSAMAYACYGLILTGFMGNLDAGERFGNLALSLLDRFNSDEIRAKIFLIVYDFIKHRKSHTRETLQPLMEGYQIGVETGDFEGASLDAHVYCYHSYIVGKELSELVQVMETVNQTIRSLGQNASLHLNITYHQAVLNLVNPSGKPTILTGEVFDKEKMLPRFIKAKESTATFNVFFHELILSYMFNDYEKAVEDAILAEKYIEGTTGTIGYFLFHFYDSLAHLALYKSFNKQRKEQVNKRIDRNLKVIKNWSDNAPMNHLHKYHLLLAEKYRIEGKFTDTMNQYDIAIQLAKKHDYIQDEALANELAARFFLETGKETISRAYLMESRSLYEKWGATSKVQQLDELNPSLGYKGRDEPLKEIEHLDLATVIKASEAVSGEILLENLLKKMMRILLQYAGAQRGIFLAENQGILTIEAEAEVDEEPSVLQGSSLEEQENIASTIVKYVLRLKETVVLENTLEGMFNRDPHIMKTKPKSILCIPLIYLSGKLTGILYLENNLVTGAFTPEKLQLLEILSSQLAISLENARLYRQLEEYSSDLEQKVNQRTLELIQKNEELINIDQEKNEILHIVSHDLKNPLTVIQGYAELAQRQANDQQKVKHFTDKIIKNTQRAFDMITSLLEVDAIYYGKITITPEKLDLGEVLNPLLEQYRDKSKSRNISISFDNKLDEQMIFADKKAVTRVLDNLLSNAIKYSPRDRKVKVRVSETGSAVRCEIQDEGPGISEEDQKKLFQKYTTLSAKPANGDISTGLGLAIAKKLVDLMNGELWCESELGKGSKFIVELPKIDFYSSL